MKFFKNITYLKRPENFLFLFGFFLSINSLKTLASEHKFDFRKNKKTYDFEEVYFQNSIPYSEYDSLDGQFKSFFGLKSDFSETNYYPDLSIISDSDAIRSIYRSKLNDMIVDENIYKMKR